MNARPLWIAGVAALGLLAASCEVGPDYVRPSAPVPAHYKELQGWKPATPREAGADQPWWAIYRDPVLDGLERQIDISNQNLKAAEAAYRQAQALVAEAASQLYPTAAISGSAQRGGPFGRPTGGALNTNTQSFLVTQNQFSLTGSASWAPDIWGKVRRTIESQQASAQASAADLAAARLSAQTTLATDYFSLRATDEQKRLLDTAAVAYTESLKITQNQFAVGNAALSAVLQAKTQLEQTQSQAINTGVARTQLEHAVAVLVGKPPGDFSIAVARMPHYVPVVPPGMPSALLERRPDIAAAERTMQAANAQIGVAVAAYYPNVDLTASLGVASAMLGNLFTASSAAWAIGSSVSETVFDAGLRAAQVAAARDVYEQDIATYRQTVLTAFQQVEDELAALRILAAQAVVEDATVRDAREAERLTLNQYLAGTVAYTSVIVAQTTALTNEESALTILQNRLTASVSLIAALGGGWNMTELPKESEITRDQTPAVQPTPAEKPWYQTLFDW
ncbi:MAG TPA: efflux transporter outer membrane subunit [Stellaceae bacterium]|nr:efflux transporter outer membrane subunit [Stellaceae bacterium]